MRASQIDTSLLHLSHRLAQRADDVFTRIAGADSVTARQLAILSAIDAREGASQTDIVELTGIDRSTMADVTSRLCRRKLVTRRRAKEDMRAYRLRLTNSGREALMSAQVAAIRADEQLLAPLSANEQGELVRLMSRLVQHR